MTAAHLLVLLAAILLDAYSGSPLWRQRWRWHPLVATDRLAGRCAEKLNRESRGARTLRKRGVLAALAFAAAAAAGGFALEALAAQQPLLWLAVLFVLAGAVDQRESGDALAALGRALARHRTEAANAALARLSMRDPVYLDSHGMARVGVEALARRLARRWTAPVFYAAVGGLPAAAAYWFLDGLAAAAGRGPFGAAPRRAARLAHWVPDRLAGLALAAAAGREAPRALAALRGAAGRDWPPAAVAAALGVALAGPRRYAAGAAAHPWIGAGRPQVGPNDILDALDMHARAVGLMSLVVGVFCVFRLFQGAD